MRVSQGKVFLYTTLVVALNRVQYALASNGSDGLKGDVDLESVINNNLRGLNTPSERHLSTTEADADFSPYSTFVNSNTNQQEADTFTSDFDATASSGYDFESQIEDLDETEDYTIQDSQQSWQNYTEKVPMNLALEYLSSVLNQSPEEIVQGWKAEEQQNTQTSATTSTSSYYYGNVGPYYNVSGDTENADVETNMVNGYSTTNGRYDQYMVALRLVFNGGVQLCGGALIACNLVLTAGHCLPPGSASSGSVVRVTNGGNDLQSGSNVRIGLYDRSDESKSPYMERFNILSYYVTNYSRDGTKPPKNDIAIVKLDGCSKKTPVRLNFNKNVDLIDDIKIKSIGWGATGVSQSGTMILEQVDMRVDAPCTAWANYGLYQNSVTNSNQICASNYDGTNTGSNTYSASSAQGPCFGDSGGPVLISGSTQSYDLMIGVVSWGSMCVDKAKFPSVFTRTSYYQSWITSIASQHGKGSTNFKYP